MTRAQIAEVERSVPGRPRVSLKGGFKRIAVASLSSVEFYPMMLLLTSITTGMVVFMIQNLLWNPDVKISAKRRSDFMPQEGDEEFGRWYMNRPHRVYLAAKAKEYMRHRGHIVPGEPRQV
ncbi:hypothetical protein PBRA_001968 [Plasmodiophora brassicae]|uniref:Uncharacterized protein n=1 Tax=Plasmodiophora brassicae TaxID=37360 RepID=A0A0G4J1G8_PLABS|nr:hypothetical protein PBRA_001968 [Plasmodiophora brassicae]